MIMHRRRSRSLRRRSPMRGRDDKLEKSFSISSLSDCSVGNKYNSGRRGNESNERKRQSRSEKYEDRNKQAKKSSRDRHTENYEKFDLTKDVTPANPFQSSMYQINSRSNLEQDLDPSVCDFGNSQMSHNEPSYIPKILSPSEDRLARLEKMVEILAQQNITKNQAPSSHTQELQSTSLDLICKSTPFITSVWLNKINEECLDRQFDEITCINFMHSKMSGFMKSWFRTLDPYVYTWPELKMLVIKTFPDTIDFASTLRMLVDRSKRSNETITQYYFSKMYLIEACKISGPNAVSCLIDGLNDSHLQREAKDQNFLTPETLYTQFFMKLLPNFGVTSPIMEREPMLEVVRDHGIREDYQNRDDNRRKEKAYDSTKCYTCGKFGHISENCRHAPICYKCRLKGHIAAKCPN